MRTSYKFLATAAFSVVALGSQAAMAHEANDIYLRASFEKADINADELSRESNTYFAGGYQLHDKMGVEIAIGEKVGYDYALGNGAQGNFDRMPVNLLANYYPLGGIDNAPVQPFLGVGVNYTRFSSVHVDGDDSMSVDSDYGFVGQVGVDLHVVDGLYATGYARYTDVNADFDSASNTADDKVRLDPLTVGAGVTYRF